MPVCVSLISLGGAHDILTQVSWTAAPIGGIIEGALCVYRQTHVPRIRISGPNVLLAAKPALSLALAQHELATNAAKYRALSARAGRSIYAGTCCARAIWAG